MKYLLVGFLILGLMLGAYEGIYKQGARKVIEEEIQQQDEGVYLEIVWDASGSMWGREQDVAKIIRSKEVLKTIIEDIEDNINTGLRIFGARRVGDINDNFLAVPVQGTNSREMTNYISSIKPLGKSPIGLSLKEALEDLQQFAGRKYIILISDGIDNGRIPPAAVINELQENNIILHVVHVGPTNNREIRRELRKLAEETGGKYFSDRERESIIPALMQ